MENSERRRKATVHRGSGEIKERSQEAASALQVSTAQKETEAGRTDGHRDAQDRATISRYISGLDQLLRLHVSTFVPGHRHQNLRQVHVPRQQTYLRPVEVVLA